MFSNENDSFYNGSIHTYESSDKLLYCTFSLDNHSDWPVEDSQAAAIGACCQEAGPLFWVRSCGPDVAHVHICPHCPLVGLYLVCYWQRWEALPTAQNWMAGQSGCVHREKIQLQRPELWPFHQGQVCHSTLLHFQQSHKCGLWECVPEHQLWEGLFHMCHVNWLWVFYFLFTACIFSQ